MSPKEAAGRRAAEFVETGMTVGLGTGSTVWFTLVALAERIERGELEIRGVPTSVDTEEKATKLGIPLVALEEVETIDLTIDGADEIDAAFDMIKGGGGALLREKVVASISRREVIVVGPDKVVERLGRAFPLPIEVTPFALPVVRRELEKRNIRPEVRTVNDLNEPFRTDNGNLIFDCRFEDGIVDAPALAREVGLLPGVVECGLFIGLAHVLVIGHEDGTAEVRERG